ncbi:eIF-2-alpha kinase GCN2 [Prorops nasuta]|uniref:eIF-2-alpha kinase GCN2 n=1 Tax=Prorops nasuta TaxID=863751 RepID=UPI0034CF92FC
MSILEFESSKERQENELIVLKSIFDDDLEDLRKNNRDDKWQPLQLAITLTPQEGMSGPTEVYAKIDLHVICCEEYPEAAPSIKFKNSQGLSNVQICQLSDELVQLANKLIGNVMILELAQYVKQFLCKYNKPSYSSFYEEMVSRNHEKAQSEIYEKQLQEDKKRQELQGELQKRQEALEIEMQHRRKSIQRLTSELESQSIPSSPCGKVKACSRRRCNSASKCPEKDSCHKGTKLLKFDHGKVERQVHIGKCLGHSPRGSVVYAGVDTTTGDLLAVNEWTLKSDTTNKDEANPEATAYSRLIKQIVSLEQELNHLTKLRHLHLVNYLSMKYIQDGNNMVIYILQEFVVGTTCSFYLLKNIPADLSILRHLAMGILSALKFLHANDVVHKDLRDTSVYIDNQGVVRLTDYSLDKRLSDIYHSGGLTKAEHDFPTVQGRGGKKADIYRYGVLLLSLLKGAIVSEKEMDLATVVQPQLRDFLSKCLINDERTRWSAEQLQQHGFIKNPIVRSPPRLNQNNEQKVSQPEQADADAQLRSPALGNQSRIQTEFEMLQWLGKGAFGDVLKVKNKLDGGIYAIKRIKLNPKKKQLNKKITREVKLLSRMNHENVVRYYNSWIESATVDDSFQKSKPTSSEETSSTTDLNTANNDKPMNEHDKSDIERLVPHLRDIEWSISGPQQDSEDENIDASSEDSESSNNSVSGEQNPYGKNMVVELSKEELSSGYVEFEKDGAAENTSLSWVADEQESKQLIERNADTEKEIQFMYIQMEFCEKSTLRTAIDCGLYKDEERVWRLFREIIEGLAHIHQQGMIHRDLKPVNIFLDSNDHVKIGDFGLATNILSSLAQPTTDSIEKDVPLTDKDKQKSTQTQTYSDLEVLGSLTTQVGTTLYVAPEISEKTANSIYNQKVDIYSLGIIFFEMCYQPLYTGMERATVLLNLRSKDIILPSELFDAEMTQQIHILQWLLNHDPSKRPTAQELLFSEYLPPPPLEETELQEMVRHTLSNNQSKAYKYLMTCCFEQKFAEADDIMYHMTALTKGSFTRLLSSNAQSQEFNAETLKCQEFIKSKVIDVYQRHGGVYMAAPLLMPKSSFNTFTDSSVKVMTDAGNVVTLPYDLRAPFARHVVWSNIDNMRRYAIDRVYRERKAPGFFHPRELYECAFDIISPMPDNLMAEAELIYIVWEIVNELPHLSIDNLKIRINHTSILEAILMNAGIQEENFQTIYSILSDVRYGKLSKLQLRTHLISFGLTEHSVNTIINLFETDSTYDKVAHGLKQFLARKKLNNSALAKQGFDDIEKLIIYLGNLGISAESRDTATIIFAPLLVHNAQQHSGIIYHITYNDTINKKKRRYGDVIAAGGRYDKMLTSFRNLRELTGSKVTKQYGVGISISLDKLICENVQLREITGKDHKSDFEVAMSWCGQYDERASSICATLKMLWSLGKKVTILDFCTIEEIFEYCLKNHINHIFLYKSDEGNILKVLTLDKDRFQERRIFNDDISDYFRSQRQSESPSPILNRSESCKSSTNDSISGSTNFYDFNINVLPVDREKLKRIPKAMLAPQIAAHFDKITNKIHIELFLVNADMVLVRTIISFFEIDSDEKEDKIFQKSVQAITERCPRHKKYIKEICDAMRQMHFENPTAVISLYSLCENRCLSLI